MAKGYAKDQPAGFTNRIERVAIVGAGGTVGSYLARGLVENGKHTVTALTREGSTSKQVDGVKVVRVNYDDEQSLVDALRGQQFLIITMNVAAPKGEQQKIIQAAGKAGVEWIMPNCFGQDHSVKKFAGENYTGPTVWSGIQAVEETGVSSWITMCCGFWYEFSLAMGANWFGFDFPNRRVTFVDEGKQQITVSTWMQCGRAIAALLSLPELPQDENDKTTVTLSQWRDKPMRFKSFTVSQRDMLDSVNRVQGTKDADWTISSEPHQERYDSGVADFKKGDIQGFGRLLYTRTFFPPEKANGNMELYATLDNAVLGLPEESLDEATKRAVNDLVGKSYASTRLST